MLDRILRNELAKRCERNSGYSLRAFSRDLEMDPSHLSKIMNGKKSPQKKTVADVLLKLGYTSTQVNELLSRSRKSAISKERKQYRDFVPKSYDVVSDWKCDAVLELTRLSHFQPSEEWISKHLEISLFEVRDCVAKLREEGLLVVEKDGRWRDASGDNTTQIDEDFTNLALRSYQKSVLKRSGESLELTPIEKRNHSSTLFLVDSKDVPEVKQMIREFREKLAGFLERGEACPDNLYQFHLGFFPLTDFPQDS